MSDQINLDEIINLMKDGTLSNFANSIKGFGNEMGVAMYLNMHFPEPKYILLCDLLFPQDNNVGSVQIDMVIVSVYGIFVIEAKNSFVGYNHDLPYYLQSFSEPVLSEEEVRNISDQLKNANIASIDNFAQH